MKVGLALGKELSTGMGTCGSRGMIVSFPKLRLPSRHIPRAMFPTQVIKTVPVESFDHLKALSSSKNGDMVQFFIMFGYARSSKRIVFWPEEDHWCVVHEIDESNEEFSSEVLRSQTNFVEAIEKRAFYFCDFEG